MVVKVRVPFWVPYYNKGPNRDPNIDNPQVRINDLAAPPEPIHPLVYIEPLAPRIVTVDGLGFRI